MPAKLPEDQVGKVVQFRYPTAKADSLDGIAKVYGFKSKSAMITWCTDLGIQILAGDMEFIETIFAHFPKPEDPRQKDLFQELVIKSKAEVYSKVSESMKVLPQELQDVLERPLKP